MVFKFEESLFDLNFVGQVMEGDRDVLDVIEGFGFQVLFVGVLVRFEFEVEFLG